MSVQWNIELVKEYANEYGYTVLSEEYVNNKHPLKMLCPDGHEFRMRWGSFRRGDRCLECCRILQGNRQRRSLDDVSELFLEYEYILLSEEYRNSNEKLDLLCPNGHNIKMRWGDFQQGTRCKTCQDESRRLHLEDVRQKLSYNGYRLVSNVYISNNKKLEMDCFNGHRLEMTLISVQGGTKCPICNPPTRGRRTLAEVKDVAKDNGDILLSDVYNGAHSKLSFLCSDGHQFDITWSSYQQGNGCPHHNVLSKGEDMVSRILECHNITFDTQKKFDGCKNQSHLPFDFYISDFNTCIEYQGRQHFEPVDFFGGKKQLKSQKKHDKIKRKFCKDNNIGLIEIPHWEFDNIKEILIKELGL